MVVSVREWFCVAVLFSVLVGQVLSQAGDRWELISNDAGVSGMHAALMYTNKVIMFDRTDFGVTQLKFPDGYCRVNPRELRVKRDCTAHSIELDLATNKIKPLKIFSDPWCSSGAHRADGTLMSTGGWNDGANVVRTIGAGPNDDWKDAHDAPNAMVSPRWYASNHILPDDRVIVVGGRRAFSYEFVPRARGEGEYQMPFLRQTTTPGAEHNLYPFLHLSTDGNLWIMANQDSILFNYKTNKVVRTYPRIAGGPRNYPASGSAVLLPLSAADSYKAAEVMVCGGTPFTAYNNVGKGIFEVALQTCGRMVITAAAPKWTYSNMPMPRVMGDMLVLPQGEILIINGARRGAAGWKTAKEPVLTPVFYNPARNVFFTGRASTIPRLYHSVAVVLPDTKILVAGSNPNVGYEFKNVEYKTELRIEKYSPYYIDKRYNFRRPTIVSSPRLVRYNTGFRVTFTLPQKPNGLLVRLYAPTFTTHTYSMNQRSLVLRTTALTGPIKNRYTLTVVSPPNTVIAPRGWWLLTVTNAGTPCSNSAWMRLR